MGEVGVVTVPPVPLVIIHDPVPIRGVLAASVVDVIPHMLAPVWSVPALAVVIALTGIVIVTSSEEVQGPFVIVQLST